MALIPAGLDFSTLGAYGENLAICTTVDTTNAMETPLQPIQLGTRTKGSDGSEYIYCKTAGLYAVGAVGYLSNDGTWTFTALTTANALLTGDMVGVMSQVASVTASPTSSLYDCLWVQIAGGCPGLKATITASVNAALYTTTSAGILHSVSASGAVLITGMVITTSATSTGNWPGNLIYPQVALN